MRLFNSNIFLNTFSAAFKSFFKWLLFIIVITAITGFIVDYLLFEVYNFTRLTGPYHSYKYAFIYTTCITVLNLSTKKWLDRNYTLNSRLSLILHIIVQTLSTVAGFIAAMIIGRLVISIPTSHSIWEDEVQYKAFIIVILVSFLAALIINIFWYGYEFFSRLIKMERAYSESRMATLRAQINPHFLFNSLNSIVALIRTEPGKAEEVTQDLADLFRYSLNCSKRSFVELFKEFESIEYYLSIEQARFGKRIRPAVKLPDELKHALLPGFILQPLVENSIKHGAAHMEAECTIEVKARNLANSLSLTVIDNGPGFESLDLKTILSKGNGLSNIYERIKTTYGKKAHFILHPNGVEIQLPLYFSSSDKLSSTPKRSETKFISHTGQ